jgi:hypothetical protein
MPNPVFKLPLSVAIREGAKLRQQSFSSFFSFDSSGHLCSCAWGAAVEAVCPLVTQVSIASFGLVRYDELIRAVQAWNFAEAFTTPACCIIGTHDDCSQVETIAGLVSHLNAVHHWSREEIADRVAMYELQQQS